MHRAVELIDHYEYSDKRHILTQNETKIPAILLFGWQNRKNATESLPPHFHRNCFEIVYISAGSVIFSIDGTDYKLSGGDVFITQPNQIHSTNSLPVSVCEMYWFHLAADSKQFLYLNDSASRYVREKLASSKTPQLHTNAKEIYPLIKSAFDICAQGSNPQLAGQYLSLLLYKIIEYQDKTTFKLTPDIGRVLNYIMDHLTDEISLEQLADISHLSVSQFKQKFKNQIGFSPRQFINYEKIEFSKTLLLEGMSVTDVSSMLGFDNSSYFAVVFKRFNLCSPTEYVKKKQG